MSDSGLKPLVPFPALLIEENQEKILVVADLHIGWEISLVDKGIHIPSQTNRIQDRLMQVIDYCKPSSIIILGDIKQAIPRISYEEWKSVPEFLETIQKSVNDVSIILGNHDGDLEPLTPPKMRIFPSGGIVVGDKIRVGLFHGHAWPSPNVLGCDVLVMGHIHPVLFLRDKLGLWMMGQVWVKAEVDSDKLVKAYLKYLNVRTVKKAEEILKVKLEIKEKQKLIVIPAFNDLVGGASIGRFEKRVMGPMLGSGSILMNDAELYLLDGTYIGTVQQVQAHLSDV